MPGFGGFWQRWCMAEKVPKMSIRDIFLGTRWHPPVGCRGDHQAAQESRGEPVLSIGLWGAEWPAGEAVIQEASGRGG